MKKYLIVIVALAFGVALWNGESSAAAGLGSTQSVAGGGVLGGCGEGLDRASSSSAVDEESPGVCLGPLFL